MKAMLISGLGLCALVAAGAANAQELYGPQRSIADQGPAEPLTYLYKIQKRGGGAGAFEGWFLDVLKSARPENGQVSNLVSTWTDKDDSTTWEIRHAGEFNGVECVYIIWAGNGDFYGWYLGINDTNGALTLFDSAKPTTTKWLLSYAGNSDEYELYTIRNAGLSRLTGFFIAMSDQGDHRTGMARNVGLFNNPRDPKVLWYLRRLPQPDPEGEP